MKKENYKITLYFIQLQSDEIAKERVKARVKKGGHDVEPLVIEKRFKESLLNLQKIKNKVCKVIIYDNSQVLKRL